MLLEVILSEESLGTWRMRADVRAGIGMRSEMLSQFCRPIERLRTTLVGATRRFGKIAAERIYWIKLRKDAESLSYF